MTRFRLTTYSTFLTVGTTMPVNLTSPTPSARPLPGAPSQPRKKPSICQSASSPRQPGITGSPWKWQEKNHRSGLTSSSATIWPLPCSPPVSEIWVMRSNISIGGSGKLRITGAEQVAARTGNEILVKEMRFPFGHHCPAYIRRCIRRSRSIVTSPAELAVTRRPAKACPGTMQAVAGYSMPAILRELQKAIDESRVRLLHKLREAGLRPTRQRMALAEILFGSGDRHVTAEQLHDEALAARVPVSLATVYNTLNQFTAGGPPARGGDRGRPHLFRHQHVEPLPLLSSSAKAGSSTSRCDDVAITGLPEPPAGMEVGRIDVIVRLRERGD